MNENNLPDHPPQQGLRTNCILCLTINEKIDPLCPECEGKGEYFQAARMMDRPSSQKEIFFGLAELSNMLHSDDLYEEPVKIKNIAYSLLNKLQIYNFDLKSALIDLYKEFD